MQTENISALDSQSTKLQAMLKCKILTDSQVESSKKEYAKGTYVCI